MCTTERSGSCKEGYCHKQEWRPAGRHFLCCRGLFFFAMCILLQQGFSLFCKTVLLLGMFRLFRINRNNKTLQRCIEKLKQWVERRALTRKSPVIRRHTFGTMMMTVGADFYTTCRLMGHADVRTT